jgi:hypothetical protein
MRSRAEIFDEANRKRPYVEQPAVSYSDAKRPRLEEAGVPQPQVQPLAPGPQSLAAVFTLTNNLDLQGFDATQVPAALAAKISVKTLATIDPQILDQALFVSLTCVQGSRRETDLGAGGSDSTEYALRSGSSSGSSFTACSA